MTYTPKPTREPTPTATITPWPPYVTISAGKPQPLPTDAPSVCPPIRQAVPVPPFRDLVSDPDALLPSLLPYYQEYLDAGGSPFNIPARFNPAFNRDLTGDGVPELIFEYSEIYILGCRDSQWVSLMDIPNEFFDIWGPHVWLLRDANRNGLPELVIEVLSLTQAGADFAVFEWSGDSFRSLLGPSDGSPFRPSVDFEIYNSVVVEPSFRDVDDDGSLELVFHGGIPVWETYGSGLPWREHDDVFEWDGERYVPYETRLSPPEFTFQAVQDGDRFTLFGRYDEAINYYQEAIFNDTLDWWSPAKREALQDAYFEGLGEQVKPIPSLPAPDPNEYPNLAAYSRFRLMLVFAVRGWLPELQTAYESLRDRYPPDGPGGLYTDMATAFMLAFEAEGDVASACDAALEQVVERANEAVYYVGAEHHGWQSEQYRIEYLCPFGSLVALH